MTITTAPFIPLPDGEHLPHRTRIVRAAVKVDNIVYLGWRHSEIIGHIARTTGKYTGQEEQGFVDEHGYFHCRREAGRIASRARQAPFTHNTLLSEQLWDSEGNPRKNESYDPGKR